ncbi:MAG: universal stress protein [Planctomycetota bacterium]|jgi:nucleotide-binding universal stress UspA family protein
MIRADRVMRRILIAVDAATANPPCIDCVVELAARLEAELIGLFVEDDELLRTAALPGARHISFLTGMEELLDLASTERELRSMASELESRLSSSAERSKVKHSFRVARGSLAKEVARAASEADMLVVSRSARPLLKQLSLGSAVRIAADALEAPVLILPADAKITGPILVLFDGSPAAKTVLRFAAKLASQGELEVLTCAGSMVETQGLYQEARDLLEGMPLRLTCRPLPSQSWALQEHLLRRPGGLLILDESMAQPAMAELREVIERVDFPLLALRTAS